MRRNALVTDTLREVRRTLSRFVSIAAIVALGVTFFVGIKSAGPDMRVTADGYFDRQNMMDIQLLSTAGFTMEDVMAIQKTEGVETVMPGYTADAMAAVGERSQVIKLISLPIRPGQAKLNQPVLLQGRLPERSGECAVEQAVLDSLGLALGRSISFDEQKKEGETPALKGENFRIVGVVDSPLYISLERGTSMLGDGKADAFALVPKEDFALPAYTEVQLTVQGARQLNCFSPAYEKLVEETADRLEDLAAGREQARYDQIVDTAKKTIDRNAELLQEREREQKEQTGQARNQLAASLAQLRQGEAEYQQHKAAFAQEESQARQSLASAQAQINRGSEELRARERDFYQVQKPQAQKELNDARSQLDAARQELRQYEWQLDGLTQTLEENQAKFEQARQGREAYSQLKPLVEAGAVTPETQPEQYATYMALKRQLPSLLAAMEAEAQLKAGIQELTEGTEQGRRELEAGEAQWREGKQALIAGENQLIKARKQLEENQAALDASRRETEAELESGRAQLESARAELDASWRAYRSGSLQLGQGERAADEAIAQAREEIWDAYRQLDAVKKPSWYVLDRGANYGYADYDQNTQRIAAISQVLPPMFFLVAALVSLTSMTRMVEEGRTQMGVLKALGYGDEALAVKYILYAGAASLTGSAIGLALGFTTLPAIIFNAYAILYNSLPPVTLTFVPSYAAAATMVGAGCTTLAAWSAVKQQMRQLPASLMRPRTPRGGRRVLLERAGFLWKRLSFTAKVTVRNLFRYKKRFMMTVFGIAGCTGLLLTGFGIRDSIMGMVGWQFGDVFHYQMQATWKDDAPKRDVEKIVSLIARQARTKGLAQLHAKAADIYFNGQQRTVTVMAAENASDLYAQVTLRERGTDAPITLPKEGIVLTEKMASLLGVRAGDTVQLKLPGDEEARHSAQVAAVTENYVNHYAYMTAEAYSHIFGKSFQANTLLCAMDTDGAFEEAFAKELMRLDSISQVSFNSGLADYFGDMMKSLDAVVVVIIVSAGALAFIVLYNLANINVTERERELATIKVLGFYDHEVTAYVYRENAALTAIGILAGLVLGVFLHRYVIETVEVDLVMFGRTIKASSYLYAAALTFAFSAAVNLVMHRKLKRINMIEALKSVE